MRYQSFYPFANQPTQALPRQQMNTNSFQEFNPYSQSPPESLSQNLMNRQSTPFTGDPFGIGQQANGAPPTNGPSKPEMYMETANRLITTVQQYAPLVQQFAPIIQNIPAMWKLYRGFQSMPDASAATTNTAVRAPASIPSPTPRPSIPKVFQPPI